MSIAPAGPIPAFVNPGAKRADDALEVLKGDARFDVREIPPDQLRDAIAREVAAGVPRVLVSGGDGSLATAASALVNTGTALAILPGGTLNHFAKDHGIPEKLEDALEVAAASTALRGTDVGMVNGRVFLNTSSVGAYVTFVRSRERLEKRWGYRIASALAALRLLGRVHRFAVALDVGGDARSFRTPLVFIGVGERELQLPGVGARVEDGAAGLHLFIVRGRARARLVALGLVASLAGRRAVTGSNVVDSLLVDHCAIELPARQVNVAVDGEIVLLESPLEYRLMRDALQVVAPA